MKTQVDVNVHVDAEDIRVRTFEAGTGRSTPWATLNLGGVSVFLWQPETIQLLIDRLGEVYVWVTSKAEAVEA